MRLKEIQILWVHINQSEMFNLLWEVYGPEITSLNSSTNLCQTLTQLGFLYEFDDLEESWCSLIMCHTDIRRSMIYVYTSTSLFYYCNCRYLGVNIVPNHDQLSGWRCRLDCNFNMLVYVFRNILRYSHHKNYGRETIGWTNHLFLC